MKQKKLNTEMCMCHTKLGIVIFILSGTLPEGDVGDIVFLQAQMCFYFQLREKFKCIEHIDKSETQLKTSP